MISTKSLGWMTFGDERESGEEAGRESWESWEGEGRRKRTGKTRKEERGGRVGPGE